MVIQPNSFLSWSYNVHEGFGLKRFPLGPMLVFLGIFGGGLLWLILIRHRFEYLITEVYNGGGPGEAIWALDPIFTILAAFPGILMVLAGLIVSVRPSPEHPKELESKVGYQKLNLFYLGEICLLVTIVVSLIGFLGISGLIIEIVQISAILMGIIVITCIIHMFSLIPWKSRSRSSFSKLPRNTAILLALEIVILVSVVFALQLYTWSLIRTTTVVITASGFLGLLLITPKFMKIENANCTKGEI